MTATSDELTEEEAKALLQVAREALEAALKGNGAWHPDLKALPPRLLEPGASFVTLTTRGALHGCIGSVAPSLPLALDVAKNAVSAALNDPRFPPLTFKELADTRIEVSVLSPMRPVNYRDLDDLATKVRPGLDGVLVERGWQRGLLLPQVWEKLPDPHEFLAHVALKAHAGIDIYQDPETKVYVFQVHRYEEE
ncbi:MAG: AmmeMemoRadiSam system protein A [Chloroflexi bacterium]|nr:AmmeMemoRadiSam system protein A [Chloroflexota bacterium]